MGSITAGRVDGQAREQAVRTSPSDLSPRSRASPSCAGTGRRPAGLRGRCRPRSRRRRPRHPPENGCRAARAGTPRGASAGRRSLLTAHRAALDRDDASGVEAQGDPLREQVDGQLAAEADRRGRGEAPIERGRRAQELLNIGTRTYRPKVLPAGWSRWVETQRRAGCPSGSKRMTPVAGPSGWSAPRRQVAQDGGGRVQPAVAGEQLHDPELRGSSQPWRVHRVADRLGGRAGHCR